MLRIVFLDRRRARTMPRRSPLTSVMCAVRMDFRDDLVETELAAHGFSGGSRVSAQHHDPEPFVVQEANRFRGRRFDRIRDAENSENSAVEAQKNHGLAFLTELLGASSQRSRIDALRREQLCVTEHYPAASERPRYALPGDRLEVFDPWRRDVAFVRTRQNRRGERMLAAAL